MRFRNKRRGNSDTERAGFVGLGGDGSGIRIEIVSCAELDDSAATGGKPGAGSI